MEPPNLFREHAQTVGDMSKSHSTDFPQVGVGLSDGGRVAIILR